MFSLRFMCEILKKAATAYFLGFCLVFSQADYKILSSSDNSLIVEINTNPQLIDDLKPFELLVGLPSPNLPKIEISKFDETSHTFNLSEKFNQIKWVNNQKVNGLNTGTLKISSQGNAQSYYKTLVIKINFIDQKAKETSLKKIHFHLLKPKIINWNVAKNWIEATKKRMPKNMIIPEGKWVNFSIIKDGIYKINGVNINSLFEPTFSFDPRSIMLFTSSAFGRDKTYNESHLINPEDDVPQNLVEVPVTIFGGSDGNLSNDDYLLFYGRGPSGFNLNADEVKWHQNLYFNESMYWLFIPKNISVRGQRINTANLINTSSAEIDYARVFIHSEIDIINPQESGLLWGNKSISSGASIFDTIEVVDPSTQTTITGTLGMIGNEKTNTRFKNTPHSIALFKDNTKIIDSNWANIGPKSIDFTISRNLIDEGLNTLRLKNQSNNSNSEPFYDYLNVSYLRKLNYVKPFDFFTSSDNVNKKFKINGENVIVWDITNHKTPLNVPVQSIDNTYFTTSSAQGNLKRFYAFRTNDLPELIDLNLVENKKWNNLRSLNIEADHLIIGPESFRNASNILINHRTKSLYCSLEDIYSEFSGGNKDPVAIKYFLKWAHENWVLSPTYVLFMGDADYDYRDITGKSKLKVPTIQIGGLNSYATDDRFVAFNGRIPEMATGRFPARTIEEVVNFCEKIVEFEKNMKDGIWKQRVTLVADDPLRPEKEPFELTTGKSHTYNSEKIAQIIPEFMDTRKIYLVKYDEIDGGLNSGITKPAATQELIESINNGTSIVNYIGHGNSSQWAQEKLLIINENRNDLELIKTGMKLPLWIAGTCNWGHFDKIDEESFAEQLIRTPMDGASAVISTSRGISVNSNIQFLERIFNQIFKDENISSLTAGSILQSVKTGGSSGELFHLFGDPYMELSLPKKVVQNAFVSPDTLSTLSIGSLNATIDYDNGAGNFILQDVPNEKSISFNFGSKQESISFFENGPELFKGSFTFSNNTLSPKFRVPKDISFKKGVASVKFNIKSDNGDEAIGVASNIVFVPGQPSTDTDGPIIAFLTNSGRILKNGDHIKKGEGIKIKISDPNGINITNRKGHEMILYDEALSNEYNITSKFKYDTNSLTSGSYSYETDTNIDYVSIKLKVWDNANNPSESEIKLDIISSDIFELRNVYNFPNPFVDKTQFTFEITQPAEIAIDIFTLSGLKINSIYSMYFNEGYGNIEWDGKDQYGQTLSNGVYLYKINAKNDNQETHFIGRIAIIK